MSSQKLDSSPCLHRRGALGLLAACDVFLTNICMVEIPSQGESFSSLEEARPHQQATLVWVDFGRPLDVLYWCGP